MGGRTVSNFRPFAPPPCRQVYDSAQTKIFRFADFRLIISDCSDFNLDIPKEYVKKAEFKFMCTLLSFQAQAGADIGGGGSMGKEYLLTFLGRQTLKFAEKYIFVGF